MSAADERNYLRIVAHYEACLERHGDNHRGVDWPDQADAEKRYRVMLEVIRQPRTNPVTLLDLGCGAGHLYDYIRAHGMYQISYQGMDLSKPFVQLCRAKYPDVPFSCGDVLDPDQAIPQCDYVVMNGVFTEKRDLSFDDMLAYFQRMLRRVFASAGIGVAFNVMSKQVHWERDDLFHLPLDTLAFFLTRELSRHFVIRNDYGLYEYTTYLYK
jgi:SAM-dependent methyltransferase